MADDSTRTAPLWPERIAHVLSVSLCVCIAWETFQVVNDDAFITFTYAKHLAGGLGLVFQPQTRVLGTTSPLWAIWLGAFSALTSVPVPLLAKTSAIACLTVASVLAGDILAPAFGRAAAIAVAPLLFFSYAMHWATGNETAAIYAFVAAAMWLFAREHLRSSLAVAALGTFLRGEVILLGLVLATLAWRRRALRLRDVWPAGGILAAGVIATWAYYGVLVPNTVVSKTVEAYTPSFESALPAMVVLISGARDYGWIALGLAVLGAGLLIWRGPAMAWLWPVAQAAGYTAIRAGSHAWYFHAVAWLWSLSLAALIAVAIERTPRAIAAARPLMALGVAALVAWMSPAVRHATPDDFDRYRCYVATAEWLAPHLQPGDRVLAQEIGVLGYRLEAPVFDMDFLVQRRPEGVDLAHRVAWLVARARPRFVVTSALETTTPQTLDYRENDGAPLQQFRLQQTVAVGGYRAAIYERASSPSPK